MTSPSTVALRLARPGDAESIWRLLDQAGPHVIGMGSLPSSAEATEQMCQDTADTVAALATQTFELEDGQHRRLFFVAVDTASDEPLGVTGVTLKRSVPNLAVRVTTSQDGRGLVMASSSVPWTRTELDSSYLGPDARGRGFGALLSQGRLMMLHLVRRQIPQTIASHIRGRFDSEGSAPFWRCFGAHFAPGWATSTEAEIALSRDPSKLATLSGHVLAVTAPVLDSLGAVNAASLPAFHLLTREGLVPNGMYDPIDGGPTLVGRIDETTTGRTRCHGRVRYGEGTIDALVSVASVDRFQVIRTDIDINDSSQITINEATARSAHIAPDTLVAVAFIEGTT